jgi:hypothetical protein
MPDRLPSPGIPLRPDTTARLGQSYSGLALLVPFLTLDLPLAPSNDFFFRTASNTLSLPLTGVAPGPAKWSIIFLVIQKPVMMCPVR